MKKNTHTILLSVAFSYIPSQTSSTDFFLIEIVLFSFKYGVMLNIAIQLWTAYDNLEKWTFQVSMYNEIRVAIGIGSCTYVNSNEPCGTENH